MRHLFRAIRTRTPALVRATQSRLPNPTPPPPQPPTPPPPPPRCSYMCDRWIEANEYRLAILETRLRSSESRVQKNETKVKKIEGSVDEMARMIDSVDEASLELLHAAPTVHRLLETWIETQKKLKPPRFGAVLLQQFWVAQFVAYLNMALIWLLNTVFGTEEGMLIAALFAWLSTIIFKRKKKDDDDDDAADC